MIFFRVTTNDRAYIVADPNTGNDGIRGEWLGVDELSRAKFRSTGLFRLSEIQRLVRVTDVELMKKLERKF